MQSAFYGVSYYILNKNNFIKSSRDVLDLNKLLNCCFRCKLCILSRLFLKIII